MNYARLTERLIKALVSDPESITVKEFPSDDENKVKRAVKYYGLKEKDALKEINRINKNKEKHYHYYTHEKWKNINNYELCINVDVLGAEKTAEYISQYVNNKNYITK